MKLVRHTAAAFALAALTAIAAQPAGPALAQTPAPVPSAAPSPPSSAAPAATASPSPAATASPAAAPAASANAGATANLAKARAEFEAWQSAKIDLSHYIPEAMAQFTSDAVKSVSDQYLKPLGALKTFTVFQTITAPNAVVYVYHAVCASGAIDEAISWNDAGKVQYIRFVPPQS